MNSKEVTVTIKVRSLVSGSSQNLNTSTLFGLTSQHLTNVNFEQKSFTFIIKNT